MKKQKQKEVPVTWYQVAENENQKSSQYSLQTQMLGHLPALWITPYPVDCLDSRQFPIPPLSHFTNHKDWN